MAGGGGGGGGGLNINWPRFLSPPRLIPFTLNGPKSDLVSTSLKSHLLVALFLPLFLNFLSLSRSLSCSTALSTPPLRHSPSPLPSSSLPPVRAGTTGERDEGDGRAPGRLAPASGTGWRFTSPQRFSGYCRPSEMDADGIPLGGAFEKYHKSGGSVWNPKGEGLFFFSHIPLQTPRVFLFYLSLLRKM